MPAKKKTSSAKRQAAPVRKSAGRKTPARKTPSRKTARRKPAVRTVTVRTPRRRTEPSWGRGPSEAAIRAASLAEERDAERVAEERRRGLERREREQAGALEQPVGTVTDAVEPAVQPVVERRVAAEPGIALREPGPLPRRPAEPNAPRPSGDVVIDVDGLRVFYGAVSALKGVSFSVRQGEVVSIIGSNGAGKTTTMKTVSGVSEMLKTVRGHITIFGHRVEALPAHKIARLGVAHVPEGRKIFPNQSVRDNLMLGAFQRKDSEIDADIEEQYERFPILGQRRNQPAGLMSGGEQQMLAIARGLMARPRVMLFDEPSMGLAPLIVKQVFEILARLKSEGMTILLVEQMAFQALGIADRAYVLETGEITLEGTGEQLLNDPKVKEAYLGA